MSRLLLAYSSSGGGYSMEHSGSSGSNHRLPLAFATSGGSKPGLSFPLGTGLVVLIILFVSALFSFCYHWLTLKKSRVADPSSNTSALITSDLQQQAAAAQQPFSVVEAGKPPSTIVKLDMVQCPPVVYMAGEYIPRFIAVPCPFVDASLSMHTAEVIAATHKKALSIEDLKSDIRL